MPRGISENDVWNACDALLLEGARPTIERVRQKIGSGSPNTVSPFLETWFKHLGGRIKDPGAFAVPSDVPDPVLQAAKHFWEAALAETRRDFDHRLQDGMAAAIANVEAEKERARQSDAAAFDATNRLNHLQALLGEQLAALETERLARATMSTDLVHAQKEINDLKVRLARSEELLLAERAQSRATVEAADQRADGAIRRAGLEIEQERQARAKTEKTTDALRTQLSHAGVQLREAAVRHTEEVAGLRSQYQAEHKTCSELQRELLERTDELKEVQGQLDSQREQKLQAVAAATAARDLLTQFQQNATRVQSKKQRPSSRVAASPKP